MRMDSWFNLVLLCGLVIIESLMGATGHVIRARRHDISVLQNAVNIVQTHYGYKNRDWVGKAVFTPYLSKVETCTCEKLVLAAMLKSYMDIFSDMLHSDFRKSSEIEVSLKGLKNNVSHLLNKKYIKEQAVMEQLQEIKLLDVKNSTIQGGAVNDFLSVYEMASRIGQKKEESPNAAL